jgi:hypothetical protein
MALKMRRDPFARGEYERACHGPGECEWCGQNRPRVFSYIWLPDGLSLRARIERTRGRRFCCFSCFQAYYT